MGSIKEAIGKLTGDARTEAEGKRQKREPGPPRRAELKPGGQEHG
ncbi:MAG: CsbD family protein [Actinomycetospora chiangmaiensis]|nr:CsbD family protein [Actinomycetospora chiangmaiensis]